MLAFIPDGYERTVGFDRVAGMHDAFWFTYRPFAGGEGADRWGQVLVSKEFRKQAEALVTERLKAWSLRNADGDVANLDAEAVSHLADAIFDKIQGVVAGRRAPDWDVENGAAADLELAASDAKN